ncbi:uncharacterized protein LY89DRAFT_710737 [Mollisia scopiformis]|uniref:Uncharacterized protein n=1 Tax=Mollisia scopiformis TaxID=149040 RepID=A0A132BEN3_MOLSC|nr:uncharacterized protein LY89DRAFT_710737 [Mollisia scopiformis]KUJ10469.1 hypothetical protein LY89DRAFT_710737 [Mollisia scopiformis]
MFYRPTSVWSWILVAATVIETGLLCSKGFKMGCRIFTRYRVSLNLVPDRTITAEVKAVPTFLSLLIFGFIYQALLLYDTLSQRNMIQLGGLCAYSASLCVYTILQIQQVEKVVIVLETAAGPATLINMKHLTYANASLTGLYTAIIICVSFKLYGEFQWTIYRQLNADLAMQKRYFTFKIFTSILKFDLFYFLGFVIQMLVVVTGLANFEFVLTVASIPFIILTLMVSTWFMRRENITGMLVVLILEVLHTALLAFYVFKLVRIYQPSHAESYLPVRKNVSSFGFLTIMLSVVTIGVAIKCMANFNKGLKGHITNQRLAWKLLEDHEIEMMEFDDRR